MMNIVRRVIIEGGLDTGRTGRHLAGKRKMLRGSEGLMRGLEERRCACARINR